MSQLNQSPFIKILIPFIVGITLGIFQPQMAYFGKYVFFFFAFISIAFHIKRTNHFLHQLSSVFILFTILSFGTWLTYVKTSKINKVEFADNRFSAYYYAIVSEIPQIKANSIKVQARIVDNLILPNKHIVMDEQVLFYFNKHIKIPRPGDKIIVNCKLEPIPGPANPFQFDYREFLLYQGISHQAYIKNVNKVFFTKLNSATIIQDLAYRGATGLKSLYRKNIRDPIAMGVTESLIFGYKDDLSKELVNSYSHTGTLHVLAVSGMHVAVVFLLLAKMLWFFDKWKHGKWIKTLIVISTIWGYCILTGLAPSIIRAGFMISLVLIGKVLNRYSVVYNVIAVSAFFILLINPYWLINVGFQLSFGAVLGIVFLQQYILPLWSPPNYLLREIWNILVISLCAQIVTFPLSLYYFNQFPNYFLLSNLLIIPLTTLVIYTGMGMVMFAKIPVLLSVFSWITEKMVIVTNWLVQFLEKLPFSYVDGICINKPQLFLIYICIYGIFLWLINSKTNGIFITLISLVFISGITARSKINLQSKNSIVSFSIPKHYTYLFSDGRKAVLFTDIRENDKLMFYVRGWLIHQRIWPIYRCFDFRNINNVNDELASMNLKYSNGFILFKNEIIHTPFKNYQQNYKNNRKITSELKTLKAKNTHLIEDSCFIRLHKLKRLQKKVKKSLSDYQNCVNNDLVGNEFKVLYFND